MKIIIQQGDRKYAVEADRIEIELPFDHKLEVVDKKLSIDINMKYHDGWINIDSILKLPDGI